MPTQINFKNLFQSAFILINLRTDTSIWLLNILCLQENFTFIIKIAFKNVKEPREKKRLARTTNLANYFNRTFTFGQLAIKRLSSTG